ncbi:MAG: ribbon-helix-helix protein, CopG family [Clostridia bacterium]|nr:ribbon-helix-helix protein, CopG family [Clostridia bacterium]MBQ3553702.1 ribbon-helix-helix protein, CopG family [Clostridia bacterium]
MSKLTAYKNNYIAENYDRINLTVPKGMKAQIEEKAKAEGKSTNGFIADLIRAALAGETVVSTPKKATPAPKPAAPKKQETPKASKKDMDIFLF